MRSGQRTTRPGRTSVIEVSRWVPSYYPLHRVHPVFIPEDAPQPRQTLAVSAAGDLVEDVPPESQYVGGVEDRLEVVEGRSVLRPDIVRIVEQPWLGGRYPVGSALEVIKQYFAVCQRLKEARPQCHRSFDNCPPDRQEQIAGAVIVLTIGGPVRRAEATRVIGDGGPPDRHPRVPKEFGELLEVRLGLLDHSRAVGPGRNVFRSVHVSAVVECE